LDHLNKEEAIHMNRIINKYSDLCRLPDKLLGNTDVTANKMITTDNKSLNTNQYKFLAIHKDEINKKVKDLMMNDVMKSSDSTYNSPMWIISKKPDI